MRVVVTQRWRMRHHVKKGERLFVVPDFFVQEPVPWDRIGFVISKAQAHVKAQLAKSNKCGECRACCEKPYIDFENGTSKPSNTLCSNCSLLAGCMVQAKKPRPCRDFQCYWLRSQSRNDIMPPELRPDRCGVFFTDDSDGDPEVFECHVSVMTPEAKNFIDAEQAAGRRAKIVTFYYGEGKSS